MKKETKQKKQEVVKSDNFRVRIVEHLCYDVRKITKLVEIFAKYNMSLASYV